MRASFVVGMYFFIVSSALLVSSVLTGCGPRHHEFASGSIPGGIDEAPDQVKAGNPRPWLVWRPGKDSDGKSLLDPMMLQGDEAAERGEYAQALKAYQKVRRVGMSPKLEESLVQRLAGTFLAVGDHKRALKIISDFYRGRVVDQIPSPSTLVLGFAYEKARDRNQAIAWFAQAQKISLRDSSVARTSEDALRRLIRDVPQSEFEVFGETWKGDDIVSPMIAQERFRRERSGPTGELKINPADDSETLSPDEAGSIHGGYELSSTPSGVGVLPPMSVMRVGALLPLTGPLTQLGNSLQQGMSIVFEDEHNQGFLTPTIRDAGVDPAYTEQVMNEMLGFEPIDVFLGPLASEHASIAADVARRKGIPMVTFAKATGFSTGNGVYRFGTTAEAQVKALMRSLAGKKLKIAVVYPETGSAQEIAALFVSEAEKHGHTIALNQSFPRGDDVTLSRAADRVIKSDIDAVFFPDSIRSAATFFVALPEKVKARVTPIGWASWDNFAELQNSAFPMDGAIFPTFFSRFSGSSTAQEFYTKFQARYKKDPDALAALGYDAALITAQLGRVMARDRVQFDDALRAIGEFDGAGGKIVTEGNGEWRRDLTVLEFRQGQLAPYAVAPREILTDGVNQAEPLPSNPYPPQKDGFPF